MSNFTWRLAIFNSGDHGDRSFIFAWRSDLRRALVMSESMLFMVVRNVSLSLTSDDAWERRVEMLYFFQ